MKLHEDSKGHRVLTLTSVHIRTGAACVEKSLVCFVTNASWVYKGQLKCK